MPDTTSTSVAPGPPGVTVSVYGLSEPAGTLAPSPVTTAIPFRTAVFPLTSAEVIVPVTYIALVSKLPLPGVPAGADGASAKHSNRPALPDQLKANFVVTGMKDGEAVPPATIDVPPPRTPCLFWPSSPAAVSGVASASGATASMTRSSLRRGIFNYLSSPCERSG